MSSIETYLGFTAWGNKKYPYIRQQHVNTVCCMCGDMLYASDNSYWIVGFDQKPRAMHAIQCIPRFDIIFIMPLAEFRFSNACQNIYCVQELGQFSMRTKEQAMHECSTLRLFFKNRLQWHECVVLEDAHILVHDIAVITFSL